MLSKFSVRKPYTIFVVVIMVIVFGIVAFTKSTMDLMPSIELPYVAVMTVSPGETPESVEKNISRPMEQQLASVQNVKGIRSLSYDNYSVLLLEFNAGTNMDTISSDIRDKIDLASGNFSSSVKKPIIYKLNPNMIPIVITAVTGKNQNMAETSVDIKEKMLRKLEGIDGVASVSSAGLVDNKIHISLNEKKIKATIQRIKDAAGAMTDDALSGINSGIARAKNGERQVEKGKKAIRKGQRNLSKQKAGIRQALKALQELVAARDGMKMVNPMADTRAIDAKINQIILPLKPYASNLKKMGVDLKKATQNSKEAAKAAAKFDIAMWNAEAQLGNKMSDLAGMSAYLKAIEAQLQGSKAQVKLQREAAKNSADISSLLTVEGISQIINAQNFQMPAGYVSDDGRDIMVTVGNEMKSIDELKNVVLLNPGIKGVGSVQLKDVADISYMSKGTDSYAKVNGEDGILLTFNKQSDYSTGNVAKNIMKTFDSLEKQYPKIHFTTLSNQGKYIKVVVGSVTQNLIIGGILAILILLFFLRDLRPTLITALSIPISVTFAFVLMYFSGVTLNVISMAGLAVGVGMLVDNSIVVIENIYRLRAQGMDAVDAAIKGAGQVAGAVTASTLTTICVFVPIVFVEGVTRQIFVDMALTIAYSLLASLIVALTMVPALGGAMFGKTRNLTILSRNGRFIEKYRKIINHALNKRVLVLLAAAFFFGISIAGGVARGFEYFPAVSSDEISGSFSLPSELKRSECFEIYDEVGKSIKKVKGVKSVSIMLAADTGAAVGLGAGGSRNFKDIMIYVLMEEEFVKNSGKVSKVVREIAKKYKGKTRLSGDTDVTNTSMMGEGDLKISVISDDLDVLRTSTAIVEKKLASVEGVENVSESKDNIVPDLRISVDRHKAIKKGLTTAQVYTAVSEILSEGKDSMKIESSAGQEDVVISKNGGRKIAKGKLLNKELRVVTGRGTTVKLKLKDIASIKESKSFSMISHEDQRRMISVTGDIKKGYNTTKVSEKVKAQVGAIDLPPKVKLDFGGKDEDIKDAMQQLLLMMGLGLLMIYLIMVAQFQSLKLPFIVMFTVPLAFTGGILALIITGNYISVVSMIGFVMLSGVVVNNGIVLIDYTNQLMEQGISLREAVVEAAATRLRPVVMTALTTILGLFPMALALETGSEMMQSVALVCIGGLLYATIMTLIVVPCMYEIMGKKKEKKGRKNIKETLQNI